MTFEGRLARGKVNYEANKFLNNSETIAYVESLASTDVDYSKKNMKKLKEAVTAQGLAIPEEATKDDLIVLLENKSDEVI